MKDFETLFCTFPCSMISVLNWQIEIWEVSFVRSKKVKVAEIPLGISKQALPSVSWTPMNWLVPTKSSRQCLHPAAFLARVPANGSHLTSGLWIWLSLFLSLMSSAWFCHSLGWALWKWSLQCRWTNWGGRSNISSHLRVESLGVVPCHYTAFLGTLNFLPAVSLP